jgi:hypothetical protein
MVPMRMVAVLNVAMGIRCEVKMVLSLSCRDSARLLSEGFERPLSRTERAGLRIHLLLCRRCRRFRKILRVLRGLMGHMADSCPKDDQHHSAPAADRRARILAAVRRAQSEESP